MSNATKDLPQTDLDLRCKVVAWLKTMRIQTALVSALPLWLGFLSVSSLSIYNIAILGVIGITYHIFGFTLNEVMDKDHDASIGNDSVHPIARGEVNQQKAKILSVIALGVSIAISAISMYSLSGTVLLAVSSIPAYTYNKYSKSHWWSNFYLSTWIFMMVLVGSLYAGSPTTITLALGIAVSIQIFIQVVEGDLKDLTGDEESICRRLGVKLVSNVEYLKKNTPLNYDTDNMQISEHYIVAYTKRFVGLVYSLKFLEITLFMWVAYSMWAFTGYYTLVYGIAFYSVVIVFITSLSMFMVYVYDRDSIKKYSSIHELSFVAIAGLTAIASDPRTGLIVCLAPIMWFLVTNKIIHSGSLNPDI